MSDHNTHGDCDNCGARAVMNRYFGGRCPECGASGEPVAICPPRTRFTLDPVLARMQVPDWRENPCVKSLIKAQRKSPGA